jgi:undecaprenyl diphosphate synthase
MHTTNNDIPQHIAIIMDGNRRWARVHHLPALEGHRRVANVVLEKLIEQAARLGVRYVTLWAWSTENWGREKNEVTGIMKLLQMSFKVWGEKMHKKGIRIRFIGDISKFDEKIRVAIETLAAKTKNNTGITVVFALNYGGRDEILRAIHKMYENTKWQMINDTLREQEFATHLDTAGIPDPELIIRTGGEQRLSGFLLWQSEYSELLFPSWYMPDFTPERLIEAINEYTNRKRRFGK